METSIGERLRALRESRSWTQTDLARESGVSAPMISAIERGVRSPSVRLAYALAQALGCSISALTDAGGPAGDEAGLPRFACEPSGLLIDEGGRVRREAHANPLLEGRLEVVTYRLEPGTTAGELAPNQPGTLETVVVLDGELELLLDGAAHRLSAGASAAHGVHRTEYRNPSASTACRFLVLVDTSRCC